MLNSLSKLIAQYYKNLCEDPQGYQVCGNDRVDRRATRAPRLGYALLASDGQAYYDLLGSGHLGKKSYPSPSRHSRTYGSLCEKVFAALERSDGKSCNAEGG